MFFVLLLQMAFSTPDWKPATCGSNLELATEFTRLKLSGLDTYPKSKCLEQKDYKYMQVTNTFSGESANLPIHFIDSYEITEVKEVNTAYDQEIYVNLKLRIDGKTISDSFSFVRLHKDATDGCVLLGSKDLSDLYLLKNCR